MREAAQALGFEVLDQRDLVRNLRTHYSRVFEELEARRLELEGKSSQEYLDKMRVGLNGSRPPTTVTLAWGIQHFREPA